MIIDAEENEPQLDAETQAAVSSAATTLPLHLQDQRKSMTMNGSCAAASSSSSSSSVVSPADATHSALVCNASKERRGLVEEQFKENEQLQRNEALHKRLQALLRRREQLQMLEDDADRSLEELNRRLEGLQLQRQEVSHQYRSLTTKHQELHHYLHLAQKWNVINDCFHIWHSGPFGTINGFRLGAEAPPLPPIRDDAQTASNNRTNSVNSINGGAMVNGHGKSFLQADTTSTNVPHPPPPPRRYLFFSSVSPEPVAPTPPNTVPPVVMVTIPWPEINAALGQVTLLLYILERKHNSGIKYLHQLHPMGSTSKIGVRQRIHEVPSVYNLSSDDGFYLFGKRNFNVAINALVQCVADAAKAVLRRDRTIVLPHPIMPLNGTGSRNAEWGVGGLSVAYGGNGVEWTRAMKYMLTDVKWLIAYAAKHVDQ